MTTEAEIAALMTPGDDVERILATLMRRPEWHVRAACRGVGPDVFFPGPAESAATATALCERCEVRAECLETALANPHTAGIWGGMSERGRRILKQGSAA